MTCKLCIIDSERYVSDYVKEKKEHESIEEIVNKAKNLNKNGE